MNANLFRLVFNKKLGIFVPTHEAARSQGKDGGKSVEACRSTLALVMLTAAQFLALPALAELPVACSGGACGVNINPTAFVTSGAASYATSGTQGIVTQATNKAVLNWQSFNVGKGYSMEFKQPGADSATLNRIWQADASAIAGTLKANGQIYLLNQNGILFKDGAQVNVGSLVASTLNIDDAVFNHPNGLFSLTDAAGNVSAAFEWAGTAEGFASSLIKVEPDAKLEAALGGAIMLFAPKVINQGEIHTQEGQTVLAAGGKVYLAAPPDAAFLTGSSPYKGLAGMLVEVDPFEGQDAQGMNVKLSGQVINDSVGKIIAERGNATLAALAVNQMGRVSATTSVTHKGSIRLLAREKMIYDEITIGSGPKKIISAQDTGEVMLGKDSTTEVLPELTSQQTIADGQTFNTSTVEVMGSRIVLDEGAQIVVPGGDVTLSAQANGALFTGGDSTDNGHRIYMASRSRIDVSGLEAVDIEMERNFIEAELRGTEMRDSVLNKNSYLRGKKVWLDIRDLPDTALADVSGYVDQIGRGIGEKLSLGGSAVFRSEGDLIQREGAVIDISGGSLRFQDGFGYTSKLISQGKSYDIGNAPSDRIYDGMADVIAITDAKWGVTRYVDLPHTQQFHAGYIQGQAAGSLTLLANAYALEGKLLAGTIVGPYQRQKPNSDGTLPQFDQLPAAARLIIGDASKAGVSGGDMKTPSVLLSDTYTALASGFGANTSLAASQWQSFVLSTEMLNRSGVGHVAVYSNGQITVAQDGQLDLPAYGSLTLTGGKVAVNADITSPGGTINLASQLTLTTDNITDTGVRVGEGVSLSVAGVWTNDALPAAATAYPVVTSGGSISIKSVSGLELASGSVLNADAGAWLNSAGKLKVGKGGGISLAASATAPELAGEVRAWGGYGQGGKLTVKAAALTLGPMARGVAGELLLAPDFFAGNGFGEYVLEGLNSVVVSDGVQIRPSQAQIVLDVDHTSRASGSVLRDFVHVESVPDSQRKAVNLALAATNENAFLPDGSPVGWLTVGEGASIDLEQGGILDLAATQHQLRVDGRLSAPAGEIRLTMNGNPSIDTIGYDAAQAIWIGNKAELLATGAVVYTPGNDGLLRGQVLDAGKISLMAKKGYVVAQSGARIDVSGADADFDIAVPLPQGLTYQRQTVAGAGGEIAVDAREGVILDATLAAAATGSIGGSLSVTLDRASIDPELRTPPYPGTTSGNPNSFPSIDPGRKWKIVVGNGFSGLADALAAGDSIDAAAPGRAWLDAEKIENAGFDSLILNAEHAVAFQGDVDLALNRSLILNTSVIESIGGLVNLDAAYVGLGNSTTFIQRQSLQPVLGGSGVLAVSAQHLDLTGYLSLQGFNTAGFTSAGDIRAVGVISSGPYPAGKLGATGSLTFTSRQIYPASLTDYEIDVQGAGGKVIFAGNGSPTPVLSAAGKLVVQADEIEQGGAIKAPFGQIVLAANDTLTLQPGSLTSVSAEGQIIPLGGTVLTGQKWVYSVGGASRELPAPEKAVLLSAPDVKVEQGATNVEQGATVDVSGGGDLLAQEWIAGLGGSKDVLDAKNSPDTYAILPSYSSTFAPVDYQYLDGASQPLAGEAIFLSGVPNLATGYYTLLPARYASLPGAFTVTAVAGTQDMLARQNTVLIDGAALVAGQSAVMQANGQLAELGRSGGYLVEPASLVKQRSEYRSTLASDFYRDSDSQATGDAGRVSIEASTSLVFDGSLAASHAEGYRGAMVDISAPRMAVVSEGTTTLPGYLTLGVDMLNGLGAESLLLGGIRSQNGLGTWVQIGTDEVLLDNDASQPLTGPEVLLVARDKVTLASGSAVTSNGLASSDARRLTMGYAAASILDINLDGQVDDADALALNKDLNVDGVINLDDLAINALGNAKTYGAKKDRYATRDDLVAAYAIGDLNNDRKVDLSDLNSVDGDGALLVVADAGGLEVVRQNTDRNRGDLIAVADASIGGHAVILDATRDNLVVAKPVLSSGGQLNIGAGRVNFGATPAGVPGLQLDNIALKSLLASVSDISLRSYSTLDIHGDVDMRAMLTELRLANPAQTAPQLRLEAAGIAGYGGNAILQASVLELNNLSGATFSTPVLIGNGTLTPAAGTLSIEAETLKLGDGNFRIAGYGQTNVSARDDSHVQGNGSLAADGGFVLASPRIAAIDGAGYTFQAGSVLKTSRLTAPVDFDAPAAGILASLSFVGAVIEHGGLVDAPVGEVSFKASVGDVKLLDQGEIRTLGKVVDIFDEAVPLPAGRVRLAALSGNVIMEAGSRIDVSAVGADAGTVEVIASQGVFRAGGQLAGTTAALLDGGGAVIAEAGAGASFQLDAGVLHDAGLVGGGDDFSALNTALGNGFTGARIFRLRNGDISVAASDTVTASQVELSTDAGSIDVYGSFVASGDKGGEIGLYAQNDLTLHGGSSLLAKGLADTESSAGSLGRGGNVILSSASGNLSTAAGSLIDVSGDHAGQVMGGDGRVWLRAQRTVAGVVQDLAITKLNGQIDGAREILAEAVKVYSGYSNIAAGNSSGTTLGFETLHVDNTSFMNNASAMTSRLGQTGNVAWRVAPGVEVRSAGDLTLSNDWNLFRSASTLGSIATRNNAPMVLTLRAAGDLNLNGSINDAFWIGKTGATGPTGENFATLDKHVLRTTPSSAYNLIAGANTAAANPFAVVDGGGNVTLQADKFVRTGTGDIRVAAGGDLVLSGNGAVIYTAGAETPNLAGFNKPAAGLKPTYPTKGGDIQIEVRGNIDANQTNPISINEWLYRSRQAEFSTQGVVYLNRQITWWPRYDLFKQGVGTLGGGDISVMAGGNISNLRLFAPTTGRVNGDRTLPADIANLVLQGGGDIHIEAAGDVTGALVYAAQGHAGINAGGQVEASMAMGDSTVGLRAFKDVIVRDVIDPMASDLAANNGSGDPFYFYGMSSATSLDVLSMGDSVSLANAGLYPANLTVHAPRGDIAAKGVISVFPGASGKLVLAAGDSVSFADQFVMSDYNPEAITGLFDPVVASDSLTKLGGYLSYLDHDPDLLHLNDPAPARIYALAGDVEGTSTNPLLVIPKQTQIQAGRDVRDLSMVIQNLSGDDVSEISAGRDVRLPDGFDVKTGIVNNSNRSIQVAGPGALMVMAGRDVDLCSSSGLLSIGNKFNTFLDAQGADLTILAGLGEQDGQPRQPDYQAFADKYLVGVSEALTDLHTEFGYRARKDVAVTVLADHAELDPADTDDKVTIQSYLDGEYANQVLLRTQTLQAQFDALPTRARVTRLFFNELQEGGKDFNAAASPQSAVDAQRGYDAVATLFPVKDGVGAPILYAGDVNFYFSQVKSERGGDVEILAPGGLVNVGLASSGKLTKEDSELGLFSVRGGDIRTYVRDDFLVNQSRVFTLGGGDILLWSDNGNIDAGKGAKTAAAAPPPQLRVEAGKIFFDISGSVSGSGIGTLNTSRNDPRDDGYLIAPNGEINAGDAGIRSAGNLSVAAITVIGADNIQVGGISTGVAVADTGGLSGLAGAGTLVDTKGTQEATASLGASAQDSEKNNQEAKQVLASFKPTFISVEVLGFGEGTASTDDGMDEAERKRREDEKRLRASKQGA